MRITDDDCYWGNGEAYRGVQDFTANGTRCLKWSHQFQVQLSNHPELTGHSYCRNPEGIEEAPFCFVEQTRRELCDVPKCGMYYTCVVKREPEYINIYAVVL